MLLLLNGAVQSSDGSLTMDDHQRTVFIPAGKEISLVGIREATVYKAGVGPFYFRLSKRSISLMA